MNEDQPDEPTVSPYDIFILVLIVLSFFTSARLYLPSTNLQTDRILVTLDWVFSAIFLLDFFITLYRAPNKRAYLKWGWLDFLGSLPTLPWTRPFRIVRAVRIARRVSWSALWQMVQRKRASSALWAAGVVVIIALTASSLLILRVEKTAPNANITTAYDALWWAFVTITTVGYGDRYPTTEGGRLLAAVLMTVGVGLFGILTSYLATNFLSPSEREQENELEEIRSELAEIKQVLKRLDERIPED